ncbi:ZIP family metal transporter [Chitinivibrio alkaliphilus]|uniref:Zinc/iron permease n=1 Tax=Chitinivibrio alkaliphilus ACht1 TaxID=1313304 RepID=U7D7Z5_9BACT|nr:ZIP family metal transporter [Chitinivibrio alkaliphilus]ERP32063.1 zinc/iron permease [Chitinivibrio alkaliphilus ACht1]
MESIVYSFYAGISTALGVVLLMIFGKPNKQALATLLGFAGGIMIAISLFELLPESVDIGSMPASVVGFIFGVALMFLVDKVLPHSHVATPDSFEVENPEKIQAVENPILRTGYLVLFGIALHNLPEGIAIGAGLESSPQLGLMVAVAVALHNIPEGLAIAGPLKSGGLSSFKILLLTLSAGLMTPVGAIIGHFFFNLSEVFVGGALAFAAGAMVYIVNDELVPNANKLHTHFANLGIMGGIILGFGIF